MIKLVTLIKRKRGMSPEAFRDHYETLHAPMAVRLLPMLARYERNFVVRNDSDDAFPDFDVITIIWLEDQAAYDAFRARLAEPDVLAEVRADEARFIESGGIHAFMVAEHHSDIPAHA